MTWLAPFSKPTAAYTGVGPFADTSRNGTRGARGLPSTPRPRIRSPFAAAFWFTFAPDLTGKVRAPKGYAFDGRGDLISLKRQARRDRARGAA